MEVLFFRVIPPTNTLCSPEFLSAFMLNRCEQACQRSCGSTVAKADGGILEALRDALKTHAILVHVDVLHMSELLH